MQRAENSSESGVAFKHKPRWSLPVIFRVFVCRRSDISFLCVSAHITAGAHQPSPRFCPGNKRWVKWNTTPGCPRVPVVWHRLVHHPCRYKGLRLPWRIVWRVLCAKGVRQCTVPSAGGNRRAGPAPPPGAARRNGVWMLFHTGANRKWTLVAWRVHTGVIRATLDQCFHPVLLIWQDRSLKGILKNIRPRPPDTAICTWRCPPDTTICTWRCPPDTAICTRRCPPDTANCT